MNHTRLEQQIAEQRAGLLPFKAVRSRVPDEKLRRSRVEGNLTVSHILSALAEQENASV